MNENHKWQYWQRDEEELGQMSALVACYSCSLLTVDSPSELSCLPSTSRPRQPHQRYSKMPNPDNEDPPFVSDCESAESSHSEAIELS